QRLGERNQTSVLHLVAHLAPARVIAVLLAAAGVPSDGLKMTARIGTDPDVGPGRRNHERSDALELGRIADFPSSWRHVPELPPRTHTADPRGMFVVDVAQTRGAGRVGRRERRTGAHA